MAKLNMAFVKFKKRAKLLSSYLPVSPRAKLLSSYLPVSPSRVKFKKRAKLLSSYLPVSPSRVLRAPGTSPYFTGTSMALHRTIWCRSTFGPRGPGLSNPASFLRPALPMAPTRDDNARDKRSVLRPNPATFLRDFALSMTMKYAVIRKRCLNHVPCLTVYCRTFPFREHPISAKITKTRRQ